MDLSRSSLFALSFVCGSLLFWSCANQGAPEGGPFDTEPPRLLQANPALKATGVQGKRFVLTFDENVKLSSQQDKIIVSPPQRQSARITASGRHVYIYLEDSLRPETTYSFYFDDVITDNNEDNPLENFSYLVSTGNRIDSLQVSGRIVDALTYEPIDALIVGVYPDKGFTDSTLKQPFPFVSKTNKQGVFTLRGLAKDSYRIFATKDNDANYQYNEKSEGLAFSPKSFLTSLKDSVRTDTIRIDSIVRRDTLHRDSLVTHPHTYYYPDNLFLRYAVPQAQRQGLERHSRPDSLICRIELLAEPKRLPRLRSLDKPNVPAEEIVWATAKGRVIDYWLRDTELIRRDSVRFALTYAKTDSLGVAKDQTDTLTFLRPQLRTSKKEDKPKASPLKLSFLGAQGLRAGTPSDSLILQSDRPLAVFDSNAIKLEVQVDSVYQPQPFRLVQDSLDRLRYLLDFPRSYGKSYRARLDSAALRDIYGVASDSLVFTQQIQEEKELGNLSIRLQGVKQHALVQLLDKSDAVLAQSKALPLLADTLAQGGAKEAPQDTVLTNLLKQQAAATKEQADSLGKASRDSLPSEQPLQVTFRDLKPGDYFLRLIIDRDENGVFSPGEYPESPEEVYYCPLTFAIKKGFTSEESWDIHAISPFLAKPEALRKVKPDEAKKKREDKNIEYYKRWGRRKR